MKPRFTDSEVSYLLRRPLGRMATVGTDGTPHVVPVEYRFNVELHTVDIGGFDITTTKKFRDVQRTGTAAIVIDDEEFSGHPKGIEIRGQAIIVDSGGRDIHPDFEDAFIRIVPVRIVTWGIDTHLYEQRGRNVS